MEENQITLEQFYNCDETDCIIEAFQLKLLQQNQGGKLLGERYKGIG